MARRFYERSLLAAVLALLAAAAPASAGDGEAGPPAPNAGGGGDADDGGEQKDAAAEPLRLSLVELMDRAVLNSRELAAERHRLAAIEAQVEQVFWAPFSGFSLSGAASVVPDRCIDTELLDDEGVLLNCDGESVAAEEDYSTKNWGPTFHVKLQGGVPLYTFGKISNAKDAVEAGRDAKQAGLPAIEQRIRYDVQRAYHAILAAREMLYTVGQGRKHLVKARERVEENLADEEGTETHVDLIKLRVFEVEVDNIEEQARLIERTALAALRYLVGGPDAQRIDVPDEPQAVVQRDLAPLEAYLDAALQHRPELEAIRHAVHALEANVDLKRAGFWPDLALVLSFRYGVTPGRTDINNWALKDNYNYGSWVPTFALALEYDLDFGLDIYELDQAKAELAAAVADQQRALDAILLEVREAYLDVESKRASIEMLEKSKRLIRGWIAAVMQGNAAGLNPSKDVKDALKEYFRVMAQMHQMVGEYNAGLAKLDRVTGEAVIPPGGDDEDDGGGDQ